MHIFCCSLVLLTLLKFLYAYHSHYSCLHLKSGSVASHSESMKSVRAKFYSMKSVSGMNMNLFVLFQNCFVVFMRFFMRL